METLLKHNNEVQDNLMKLWDEKKEKLGLGEYSDEIALHIENQNTELLKKIAEGEIARLSDVIKFTKMVGGGLELSKLKTNIYHQAIQDQLTHWQQVLQDLEK